MRNLDLGAKLPETPEDQRFLLGIPDDLEAACLHVQDAIGQRLISAELRGVEMVVAVKQALGLPVEPHNKSATIVICNSIREAIELCGFASPEIIFQKLRERKERLQAASMTA